MSLLNKEPVKRVAKTLKEFDYSMEIITLESTARTAEEAAKNKKKAVKNKKKLLKISMLELCFG